MARSTQVSARERAREAVRRREAERAAREKRVQQELTNYFEGDELVAEGTAKKTAAIAALIDSLGESPADVADLLGLEAREVNRLKREAAEAEVSETPASSDPAVDSGSETGRTGHNESVPA